MPFEIIRNDITRTAADAIVNPANPDPVVGGGTDSAIHAAAGPKLLEARKRIGKIAVGTSAKTKAYDLPAKYVRSLAPLMRPTKFPGIPVSLERNPEVFRHHFL